VVHPCGAALADGGAIAGNKIFQAQCSVCHSDKPGVNGFGPSLAGVVGRQAASIPGFDSSTALKNSHLTWDAATLDQFLTDAPKKVPGTAMAVAIASSTERADLIAYLSTLVVAPPPPSASTAPPQQAAIAGPTQADLDGAAASRQNWLYASHDYAGTRFSELKQITPANAAKLRAVCLYRFGQAAPTQTNPLVYDGVMYLTFGRATVAIDATTCRERWTYNW
jgi:cytochrome c2